MGGAGGAKSGLGLADDTLEERLEGLTGMDREERVQPFRCSTFSLALPIIGVILHDGVHQRPLFGCVGRLAQD